MLDSSANYMIYSIKFDANGYLARGLLCEKFLVYIIRRLCIILIQKGLIWVFEFIENLEVMHAPSSGIYAAQIFVNGFKLHKITYKRLLKIFVRVRRGARMHIQILKKWISRHLYR